ncbi:MAG: dioxygenase family protein [Ferrimicrobium sp.]
MPVLYIGHGAPTLVDDVLWTQELASLANDIVPPRAILVVSAHWESHPVTVGATSTVPLVYDFWGFPERYYTTTYPAPGAPWLADRLEELLGDPIAREPKRGLDHGAFVPLSVMYPDARIPVLQLSLPTLSADPLVALGRSLAPLRDEGVLILASGFFTHNLRAFHASATSDAAPPSWSEEFDHWGKEVLSEGAYDRLINFAHDAPGAALAHPRTEHLVPLFVALGAGEGEPVDFPIEGFWYGLAKRSVRFG